MTESHKTQSIELNAPTDKEAFNRALNALLQAAHENDVNLGRSWDCRNGPAHPDWDITIVEVKKLPETGQRD